MPAGQGEGQLDPTFGSGGIVMTDFAGGDDVGWALALQPNDGKLVAVGSATIEGTSEFALARYSPDGSLDPTFGDGGRVTTPFASDAEAFAVTLQPDGKIIAAGDLVGTTTVMALARYGPDGTLDPSFGGGQVVITFAGVDDEVNAVTLWADSLGSAAKVIVAGFTHTAVGDDFALARYHPDGHLDSTFGVGGKTTTDFFGATDQAVALAVAGNQVVAAGFAQSSTGDDFALARYNRDGTLDPAFGTGGKVTTDFFGGDDQIADVVADASGLLAVGSAHYGAGLAFALARYNADGSLDPMFGRGGKVVTPIGATATASAVALQPDGKIIVAGSAASGSSSTFALVRYTPDGGLDPTFGTGGMVTTAIGSAAEGTDVALPLDGTVVVLGQARSVSTGTDFALARYGGTTTTLPPGTTPTLPAGCPAATTIASLVCRIDTLIATVEAVLSGRPPQEGLVALLRRGRAQAMASASFRDQGHTRLAKKALRKARRALIRFIKKLDSHPLQRLVPAEVRTRLRGVTEELAGMLRTLAGRRGG